MESTHLLVFIYRHLKTLAAVGLLAAIASSGVALTLDEYYESTVIMFASSQNSLGEQFFEETKKNDLLAFGETEDAERLLQILNSHRIRDRVIEKYDLFTHYNIDPSTPGARADMAATFKGNVSSSLTRYGSIQIRVLDVDPELARDMANDMAFFVDSVANNMRNDRAERPQTRLQHTRKDIHSNCRSGRQPLCVALLGIYDFENQVKGLTPIRHGLASGRKAAADTMKKDLQRLGELANPYNNLTAFLEAAYEQRSR